jgi:hypothetical protein
MYRCEGCGRTFQSFRTPGQCPLCGVWASVKCHGCGHTGPATEFINAGNTCPKCGIAVYFGKAPSRAPSTYPVTFEADYIETRSRLTTFFRPLLAIPHAIVLALWAIGVLVAVVIAWFALLFTGRWPQGLYDFVTSFMRYATRVNGYFWLLCDAYPPFDGAEHPGYPVRLHLGPALPEYNRLKVLLRIFYIIPAYLALYVMTILLELAAFASWVVILVIGRLPKGLFDVLGLCVSYMWRAYPLFLLVTETYPPLTDSHEHSEADQAVAV